jgi:hypothetical protein
MLEIDAGATTGYLSNVAFADSPERKQASCLHFSFMSQYEPWDEERRVFLHVTAEDQEDQVLWISPPNNVELLRRVSIHLPKKLKSIQFRIVRSKLVLSSLHLSPNACHSEVSCDFESGGFCSFDPIESTDSWFERVEAKDSGLSTKDATFLSPLGHYLLTKSKNRTDRLDRKGKPAVLLLRPRLTENFYLVSFDWHVPHKSHGDLIFILESESGGQRRMVWHSNSVTDFPMGKVMGWERMQFTMFAGKNSRLLIQYGGDKPNAIALDNFELRQYSVRGHGCDFGSDFCLFKSYPMSSLLPTIGSGRLENSSAFCEHDLAQFEAIRAEVKQWPFLFFDFSTAATQSGLYFESWLVGPTLNPHGKRISITFEYFIFVPIFSKNARIGMNLMLMSNMQSETVFSVDRPTNRWVKEHLVTAQTNAARMIIRTFFDGAEPGVIGLRNLNVIFEGAGQIEDVEPFPDLSCDFHVDLCGWKTTDSDLWKLNHVKVLGLPSVSTDGKHLHEIMTISKFNLFNCF